MALITDRHVWTHAVVRNSAMCPGLSRGHHAPGWAEVTLVATDTGRAPLIIIAMAYGALRKILLSRNSVESPAPSVQPRRSEWMRGVGTVTIVALCRRKPGLTIDIVAIVADPALIAELAMRRGPVTPVRIRGYSAPESIEMALSAT